MSMTMPTNGQDPVSPPLAAGLASRDIWSAADESLPDLTTLPTHSAPPLQSTLSFASTSSHKSAPVEVEGPERDTPTPVSSVDEPSDRSTIHHGPSSPEPQFQYSPARYDLDCVDDPFPRHRFLPNSSTSYLKPGARFAGLQRSDKQEYEVTVELQHVDMEQSFLCGYLKIRGLTDEHPTLTTYFEGEMIGSKYGFVTNHPTWGANEKVDFQHWARFPAWRPLQKDARRHMMHLKNWQSKEHIWMRWKEHFLVPDHRVKDLNGASFDGFYYICFNQLEGTIQGTYYHARSDK